MHGITELRQIGENEWKAKYHGNYGVYTIKIAYDGKKRKSFSCTCPSDFSPCKHIFIVEEAIEERIAINKKQEKQDGLQLEDLIKNVSVENLRKFLVSQALYNPELANAMLLEFAANAQNTKGNKYLAIIQKALTSVTYNIDDYYYTGQCQDIDALDQWIRKANDCVDAELYHEAVLICKAIIEEYSQWLYDIDVEDTMMFPSEYQYRPFEIIEELLMENLIELHEKDLFDFCFTELKKEKYTKTDYINYFHQLLGNVAVSVDPDKFIALQDELLENINDKGSHEAAAILKRKINFYRSLGKSDKAWMLIKDNIQIESFRLELTEERIKKRDFITAKKLINDFIEMRNQDPHRRIDSNWYKLLLDIAQKEKDIPSIRELAFRFIKDSFNEEYYYIYKKTFSLEEWAGEQEKLLQHYDNEKYFSNSAADLLVTEKDTGRLLSYIEKYLSLSELERYYKVFADDYPEKTLMLFKKALISYARDHVGRSHYENIYVIFEKMSKIKGGKKVISDIMISFRDLYRNRRAMMEVLRKF